MRYIDIFRPKLGDRFRVRLRDGCSGVHVVLQNGHLIAFLVKGKLTSKFQTVELLVAKNYRGPLGFIGQYISMIEGCFGVF